MDEKWQEVPGFPGYFVSDQGRVLGRRGKVLRPTINRTGKGAYMYVGLAKADGTGGNTSFNVHRLVLEAFVGVKPEGFVCRHLNGNPQDNRLVNLRWGTPQENADDRVAHGRVTRHHGGQAKLSADQVTEIRTADYSAWGAQTRMARRMGVSDATISNVRKGRLYRNA